MSSLGMASSTSQMNKSWLGWRTGSSGVRSSPSTAETGAAIGASNREGEGSIVISLTLGLLSSFHIRKRIIVISDSPPRLRHFDFACARPGRPGATFIVVSPFGHSGFDLSGERIHRAANFCQKSEDFFAFPGRPNFRNTSLNPYFNTRLTCG